MQCYYAEIRETKTQKDFYPMDDTQQESLRSSKFRKYFTQAFLFLVLLKIQRRHQLQNLGSPQLHLYYSVGRAGTCIRDSGTQKRPPGQLWGGFSGTPAPRKPECSPGFALKCMQGHISPLSLQLGWPPPFSAIPASMSASQHWKTRQALVLSRLAWSVPTARAEGLWTEFSCPQQKIWGPGNGLGFSLLLRLYTLGKRKHNPVAKG